MRVYRWNARRKKSVLLAEGQYSFTISQTVTVNTPQVGQDVYQLQLNRPEVRDLAINLLSALLFQPLPPEATRDQTMLTAAMTTEFGRARRMAVAWMEKIEASEGLSDDPNKGNWQWV